MLKQKIVNLLKYNKFIYKIYYYSMSIFINIFKLFLKPDNKLILFNSYAGRKYDDSPKEIFDVLKKDSRFSGFHFVWAFHQPELFDVDGAKIIKTDSLAYFKAALKARVWVTNSSMERGLNFKGKNTLYLNTWHGTPIKKIGADIVDGNTAFSSKSHNLVDFMNTQSYYEADIFSRSFKIPRDHFLEIGLPRNDALVNYSEEYRLKLRETLNIPADKLVILYCPTFREYEKDDKLSVVLAPPIHLDKWEKELGEEYILLFRAHYEVSKVLGITESDFIRNVTNYPSLNDLMIASDILISDYSSIFFDYSIMDKCMIHFTYDYDKYEKKRGLYFDIREYVTGSENEDGVIEVLKSINLNSEVIKTRAFRENFLNFYGDSASKTVDFVAQQVFDQ